VTGDGKRTSAAVTVRLPPYWRKHTDRKPEVPAEGATVGEALEAVAARHPELRPLLFSETGVLQGSVSVFLNRESVARRQGLATALRGGDQLSVILAIAGG
jgi:molybdopterin converting factor small subunit